MIELGYGGGAIADYPWHLDGSRPWSQNDDEAEAYLITANRTPEAGGWHDDILASMLERITTTPLGLDGIGYTDDDLAELLVHVNAYDRQAPSEVDPDDVPEPPAEPVTKLGDTWLLGPHRILCADATKRDSYSLLLDGERPEMLLTDPPYGVSHGSGVTDAKAIRGDIGQAVIPVAFACALETLSDNARLYVFGGSGNFAMYMGLWDHHLHDLPRVIVWVKESFVMRQIAYHSQYELVYWGWKGSGGSRDCWWGERTDSDVWQIHRDRDGLHPTQKPVALLQIPIRNSCPPDGLVLEPFSGSGATIIAAHLEGRRCFAMEVDPGYVDVACKRFERLTDQKPVLEATGEPVSFLDA